MSHAPNIPKPSTTTSDSAPMIGKVIPFASGKLTFIRELGSGGMARVHKARFQNPAGNSRYTAVKSLFNKYLEDNEVRKLFEAEAQVSTLLRHENIIRTYGMVSHEGEMHLVMEFLSGKNLSEIRQKLRQLERPLARDLVLLVVRDIARALAYAHAMHDPESNAPLQLVHRDVTPRNIMIGFDGTIKLLDFGIAKFRQRAIITQSGFFRGTPKYASPEQLAGGTLDNRSDIYSLGTILKDLLDDCEENFHTDSAARTEISVIDDATRRRMEICTKCVAPKPEQRYADASELADELDDLLQKEGGEKKARKHLTRALKEAFPGEMAASVEDENLGKAPTTTGRRRISLGRSAWVRRIRRLIGETFRLWFWFVLMTVAGAAYQSTAFRQAAARLGWQRWLSQAERQGKDALQRIRAFTWHVREEARKNGVLRTPGRK